MTRAMDRAAKEEVFGVSKFPLWVAYTGHMNSLSHIPSVGPQAAIGKDGRPYASKYVFQRNIPVEIFNQEHKDFYRGKIERGDGPWAEMTRRGGEWVVKKGHGYRNIPPVPMSTVCPYKDATGCTRKRADFGAEGMDNDRAWYDHIARHTRYPFSEESIARLKEEYNEDGTPRKGGLRKMLEPRSGKDAGAGGRKKGKRTRKSKGR